MNLKFLFAFVFIVLSINSISAYNFQNTTSQKCTDFNFGGSETINTFSGNLTNFSQMADSNTGNIAPNNGDGLIWDSSIMKWRAAVLDSDLIWKLLGGAISPLNSSNNLDMSIGGGNVTANVGFFDSLGTLDDKIASIFVTEIEQPKYIQFNTTFPDGGAEGRLQWNQDDGTLEFGMPGGEVNLQIGQEMLIRARNLEGEDITNCQAVWVSGATGNVIEIMTPIASNISQAPLTFALATENILNNLLGYVTITGLVRDCDTSDWDEGDVLYLSATEEGNLTNIRPIAPNTSVVIGIVTRSHLSEGVIAVNPTVQQRLSFLSDVYPANKINNSILSWDGDAERHEYTISPFFNNITGNNFIGGDGFFDNIYSRDEVDELVDASAIELFFKDSIPEIETYWDMNRSSNDRPKNETSTLLSADLTEIGGFVSPNASELGIKGLDSGIVDAHFHASVDLLVGKKDVAGFFQVYIRNSSGDETLLTTSHLVPVDTTIESEYEAHANVEEEIVLDDGDRIVMKMFANLTGSGGNPTLTVYIQGNTLSRGIFATVGVNFATRKDLESYYRLDGTNDLEANIDGQGFNLTNWNKIFADDWSNVSGSQITNDLNWINESQIPDVTGERLEKTINQDNDFITGHAVYYNGSDYLLALSNDTDTIGTGLVTVINSSQFVFTQVGFINIETIELTPGSFYFVSETDAGNLTTNEGSDFSNPIFQATNQTSGYVFSWRASTVGGVLNGSQINNDLNWINITEGLEAGFNSTFNVTYDEFAYNQTIPANAFTIETNNSLASFVDNTYAKLLGGNQINGTQNFNGGWSQGGSTIDSDGNHFVQTLYAYNISSLVVSHLFVNGSLIPSFDNLWDLGSALFKWKDLYLGGKIIMSNGNISSNATSLFYNNGSQIFDLTKGGGVPENAVVSFNQETCPLGWVLADGSDGTPDLVNISIDGQKVLRKQYLGDGTDFTVTLPPGGGTLIRAIAIPYQTSDGTWRLKFNIAITMNSATDASITLSGVVAKNVANYNQVFTIGSVTNEAHSRSYKQPNNGHFVGVFVSPVTGSAYSGDIELESKPTWADADSSLIYCVKTAEDTSESNSIWQTIGDIIFPVNSSKTVEIVNLNVTGNLTVDGSKVGNPRTTTTRWRTVAGYGSSSNKIQEFVSEIEASNDVVVTIVNSASLGFTITANMDCIVHVSYGSTTNAAGGNYFGLTKNSNALTTVMSSAAQNNFRLAMATSISNNLPDSVSWSGILETGDVVRPHTEGLGDGTVPEWGGISVLAIEIIE